MTQSLRARLGFGALAAAAFVTCSPGSAWAAGPAEHEEADRLFRDGRARMLEGRFDEACPMLEESQRLDPSVGTLLNLAACHERQGKIGSAWVEYQKALIASRADGQAERVRLAEERTSALEPRVPWLRVVASADAGAVSLDGVPLPAETIDRELPVDPGVHVVRADAQGAPSFEEHVDLREGERRTVVVRFASSAPAGTSAERIIVEPRGAPAADPPRQRRGSWIFEPGLFVGYMTGNVEAVAGPSPVYPASISVETSTGQLTTCAQITCTLGRVRDADGVMGGVNVFAGYALTESLDVGLRVLAGPELGAAGASVLALGPSLAVHPLEGVTLGVWLLVGNATLKGNAEVVSPDGDRVVPRRVAAEGGLEGGPGAGLELTVRLFDLGRGSVVLNATPFVLAGSGTAIGVPVGLGYRFW